MWRPATPAQGRDLPPTPRVATPEPMDLNLDEEDDLDIEEDQYEGLPDMGSHEFGTTPF